MQLDGGVECSEFCWGRGVQGSPTGQQLHELA